MWSESSLTKQLRGCVRAPQLCVARLKAGSLLSLQWLSRGLRGVAVCVVQGRTLLACDTKTLTTRRVQGRKPPHATQSDRAQAKPPEQGRTPTHAPYPGQGQFKGNWKGADSDTRRAPRLKFGARYKRPRMWAKVAKSHTGMCNRQGATCGDRERRDASRNSMC